MALGENHAAEILPAPGPARTAQARCCHGQSGERQPRPAQRDRPRLQRGGQQPELPDAGRRKLYSRRGADPRAGARKGQGVFWSTSSMVKTSPAWIPGNGWMRAPSPAVCARSTRQVVALVLSSLRSEQAAEVVNPLPSPLRDEALLRVAILDEIPSGALAELNELIEKQVMRNISAAATSKIGGPKRAAEILGRLDAAIEGQILDKIKEVDADLGGKIEDMMVVFENLLDRDRDIQTLLREVSSETLLVALRGADEAVRQKIMGNMSRRAADLLRDDLESHAMGEAQRCGDRPEDHVFRQATGGSGGSP
ncbi:MAG: hypothetical protein MZV70_44015 [Desulfobacterales bacterium]|nr:hypothetical protein [Desulfobacterales bacterium]